MTQQHELIERALRETKLSDGEGNTYRLYDLLDFSGENKTHMIVQQLAQAAIQALQPVPPDEVAALAARLQREAPWFGDLPKAAQMLLALSAQIEGQGWQPIETAPECWMEDRQVLLLLEDGSCAVSKHKDTDGVFHAGDWEYPLDATHWQPLPKPPTQQGE